MCLKMNFMGLQALKMTKNNQKHKSTIKSIVYFINSCNNYYDFILFWDYQHQYD